MKLLLALFFSLITSQCLATTLNAKIVQVGCHTNDDQCFAYLDKPIGGVGNCEKNKSMRWSLKNGHAGKEAYSTFLAAKISGKRVHFGAAGDVCYKGFTSFNYFHLID